MAYAIPVFRLHAWNQSVGSELKVPRSLRDLTDALVTVWMVRVVHIDNPGINISLKVLERTRRGKFAGKNAQGFCVIEGLPLPPEMAAQRGGAGFQCLQVWYGFLCIFLIGAEQLRDVAAFGGCNLVRRL